MKTKLLNIFKVIICLGLLLVIGVSVFGCGSKAIDIDSEFNFGAIIEGLKVHTFKVIVNSFEEWMEIFDANFTWTAEDYNEQFFDNNSLVVYAPVYSNGGSVNEIKVSKNQVELLVEINGDSPFLFDLGGVTGIIITVKKTDISGVTSLSIADNVFEQIKC